MTGDSSGRRKGMGPTGSAMFSLGQMQKRWNAKQRKGKPVQTTTGKKGETASESTTPVKSSVATKVLIKAPNKSEPFAVTKPSPKIPKTPGPLTKESNKDDYSKQIALMHKEFVTSKKKITALESRLETVCAQLEKKDRMFTRLHTAVRSHATLLKSKVEVLTGILAELCSLPGAQGGGVQGKDISTSRAIGLAKDLHRVLRESIVATSAIENKSDK